MRVSIISQAQLEKVSLYAEFVAQLRTTVTSQAFREYDTSEWQLEPEFATRLGQQLRKLAECVALVRQHSEIVQEDMDAVSRVAKDTCLPNRLEIVKTLYYATSHRNHNPTTNGPCENGLGRGCSWENQDQYELSLAEAYLMIVDYDPRTQKLIQNEILRGFREGYPKCSLELIRIEH
jgi:hypothetical protein